MPRRIKPKTNATAVGQVILDYWKSDPRWDRQRLRAELQNVLDLNGGQFRNVVFDVILDSEIDENTRMVWISVPTPDLKKNPSGSDPKDWKQYAAKFKAEVPNAEEQLGSAVLFGCGR